jgi:hypothetical protein
MGFEGTRGNLASKLYYTALLTFVPRNLCHRAMSSAQTTATSRRHSHIFSCHAQLLVAIPRVEDLIKGLGAIGWPEGACYLLLYRDQTVLLETILVVYVVTGEPLNCVVDSRCELVIGPRLPTHDLKIDNHDPVSHEMIGT